MVVMFVCCQINKPVVRWPSKIPMLDPRLVPPNTTRVLSFTCLISIVNDLMTTLSSIADTSPALWCDRIKNIRTRFDHGNRLVGEGVEVYKTEH